jgi:hypothetical protein
VRGPLVWVLVAVGIVAVLLVTVAIGGRDKTGETVPTGEWAHSVCGSVAVWRGEMEAIVEEIRTPASVGALGVEEPQSQTPQGRRGFVRDGLEQAVQATDTLVEAIDNAGVPDTPAGSEASDRVSEWASDSQDALEEAQDSLDDEADTLEEAVRQIVGAAGSLGSVLTSGVRTIAEVATVDPQLATALRDASTCQQLREEERST